MIALNHRPFVLCIPSLVCLSACATAPVYVPMDAPASESAPEPATSRASPTKQTPRPERGASDGVEDVFSPEELAAIAAEDVPPIAMKAVRRVAASAGTQLDRFLRLSSECDMGSSWSCYLLATYYVMPQR